MFILLSLALLIALPSQTSVAFAASEAKLDGHHSVVYGKVTDGRGESVAGARVKLIRWVGGERHVLRTRQTSTTGVYRFELRRPKRDTYIVRVFKARRGPDYVGTERLKMRPGIAFRVNAKLVESGRTFFLPITTY